MGWVLIVTASIGGYSATAPSFAACEQMYRATPVQGELKTAVCRNMNGDTIDLTRYAPEPPAPYCTVD